MKKVISKNDIKMKNGKKVHLISANIYLEVMKGLYPNEVDFLQQELMKHTNTIVTGYATNNATDPYAKNFSWIIRFENIEAAIFAYFLLDHYNRETKFIRGSRYFTETQITQ